MSMIMAHGSGMGSQRFLFEIRPDVFPEGFLTPVEIELWIKFFEDKKQRM